MSGTIFSVCSKSEFSALPARNDVEKDTTRNMSRENCGKAKADVEPGSAFCGKLSNSVELECIQSPGILKAPSQEGSNLITQCAGKPAAGGSNQNDAVSNSQVWLTDAKLSERARKLAAEDTSQGQIFSKCNLALKFWTSTTRNTRSGRTISA